MGTKERLKKTIVTVLIVAVVVLVAVALGVNFYSRRPGPWKQVTIATATKGGTYYVLGEQLARILEDLPGKPIKSVKAEPSQGSQENIQRLITSEADVAFVMRPTLVKAAQENSETLEEVRVLARLYTGVLQIVARKDRRIESITDFKNKNIYIGAPGSGTRMMATQILEMIGLPEGNYAPDDAESYAEAASKLILGKLDGAFFVAGIPTPAVQKSFESGECQLLSLDVDTRKELTKSPGNLGFVEAQIPPNSFPNQLERVQTVGWDALLVCRNDLPEGLAFVILEALFDNIGDLLLAHAKAGDIKLTKAFDVPEDLPLHPGARKFQEKESGRLLIATGAINGKYYHAGRMIQLLLKERGIHARVVHTDGSLENAKLLGERPTIAIMQYDAALASRLGEPRFVYGVHLGDEVTIPAVRNIRRIAVLHQEQVHLVMRRDKLVDVEEKLSGKQLKSEEEMITTLGELAKAARRLSSSEEKLRICLGPKGSATQIVAQAILKHHKIESSSVTPLVFSVSDMVSRLQSEEIDGGFYVSHVPSDAIKTILNDGRMRLLSLGSRERALMTGTVFTGSTIEPGTYACQKEGEPPIQTIATKAVLVTTKDLPFNVKTITRAIFEGGAFLGIEEKAMAKELPSLPLHRDTKQYYQEAGYLPSRPPIDWLAALWRALASLMLLIGGYKGLFKLRRDRTANMVSRRILGIPLEANVEDSVARLLTIRDEIQERVRRRWWRPGDLDKSRWRYLHDLVDDRMKEAKEDLTRSLVAEIHAIPLRTELDETARQQCRRSIERRVWEYFKNGELDASQGEMLRELLRENGQQD